MDRRETAALVDGRLDRRGDIEPAAEHAAVAAQFAQGVAQFATGKEAWRVAGPQPVQAITLLRSVGGEAPQDGAARIAAPMDRP
ncbi:MAG: hypothetical protein CAPSK01_003136 [Candidatus Accumulibacter vicinus]|uniref:Uncharacterized protein n=1 Tax=Candidatus Accumulibacter vicinus TaxID=2954382 RepID=A0A084XY34_9PROT|nr:MAG: hypothetical protein CAPSK01_003136 [Candidatus Accumulibacter vicinus]